MIVVRCRCAAVLAVMLFTAAWLFPTSAHASSSRHHHGKKAAWFEMLWPIASTQPVLGVSRIVTRAPSDDIDDDFDDRDTHNRPTLSADAVDDGAETNTAAPPWVSVESDDDPRAARLTVWRKLTAPRPPPSL